MLLDSDIDKLARAVAAQLSTMSLPPPKRILNSEEAATYLGVGTEALKIWRREGRGPAFKRIGNRCIYTLGALNSWVHRQPEGSVQ
jgi:hypothetical protein